MAILTQSYQLSLLFALGIYVRPAISKVRSLPQIVYMVYKLGSGVSPFGFAHLALVVLLMHYLM